MNPRPTPRLQSDTPAQAERPVAISEMLIRNLADLFSQGTSAAFVERTTWATGEAVSCMRAEKATGIDALDALAKAYRIPGKRLQTFEVDMTSPVATRIRKYLGDMWPHYFHFLNVDGDMYVNDHGKLLGIRQAKR